MKDLIYSTTPEEDAAVAFVVERANQARATAGLEPKTAQDYFNEVVAGVIASYAAQKAAYEAEQVKAAYQTADPMVKDEVRTKLGVSV